MKRYIRASRVKRERILAPERSTIADILESHTDWSVSASVDTSVIVENSIRSPYPSTQINHTATEPERMRTIDKNKNITNPKINIEGKNAGPTIQNAHIPIKNDTTHKLAMRTTLKSSKKNAIKTHTKRSISTSGSSVIVPPKSEAATMI